MRAATVEVRHAARLVNATKVYGSDDTMVTALDKISVAVPEGRFTAVMGPSGSGKSTLLHCMAGLDSLTSGQVFIGDVELGGLGDTELTLLRRRSVGFVFQAFNLPHSLLESVLASKFTVLKAGTQKVATPIPPQEIPVEE